MKVLVTGSAGFIGNRVTEMLLERGCSVIGVDNLDPYYDVSLKRSRLAKVANHNGFTDVRMSIAERDGIADIFYTHRPDAVINLAAQAGVRHSLKAPHAYAESNLVGFLNILEGCRTQNVKHLVYASSSSVYGTNKQMPFSVRPPHTPRDGTLSNSLNFLRSKSF